MEPGALGRRRRRGGAFSLARLFANGEAGGVYDPSDLTAEKVAWRRNLLTWSEDFTNAAWTKNNITISANAAVAPDGTTTADKLIATATTSVHSMYNVVVTVVPGVAYTASVYVKAAEYNFVAVVNNTNASYNASVCIDLTTGAQSNAGGTGTYTVTNAGNGWWQVSATVAATSANGYLEVHPRPTAGPANSAFLGDGASGVLVWGAQLERGSTATAYQRITDFTSDFLAAFPTHGLYQDAAGTTPVTALGQPVGLVIDSKTGGLANLGPDIVTNGTFATNITGWTAQFTSTAVWDSGTLKAISSGTNAGEASAPVTCTIGRTYQVTGTIIAGTSPQARISASNLTFGEAAGSTGFRSNTGTYTFYFTATATTMYVVLGLSSSTNGLFANFDNISVREVPGVHAIQPTNSSRPLLDGRVNLLVNTGFAGAVAGSPGTAPTNWTFAFNTGSIAAVTPDGSGNNTLGFSASATRIVLRQDFAAAANTTYCCDFTVVANSGVVLSNLFTLDNLPVGASVTYQVNGAAATGSTVPASGAQVRAFLAVGATAGTVRLRLGVGTDGSETGTATLSRPSVVLAADAAYPYQRVAAATDYADVGVPRSFAFDGFDDSLYTASNMDLSGTDKVTVLAGVRKLSDAGFAPVVELSATVTNNGAFAIYAPGNTGVFYQYAAKGTALAEVFTGASQYTAPHTAVVTGQSNIAAPSLSLRVNAVLIGSSTASQGTGNYSSAVLFIGRRNNTSNPFNGKAYQLIVRGALTDAATLAQAERYVGAKTGLYL